MIKELKQKGWTLTAIAEETGYDRKTIRKYLNQEKLKLTAKDQNGNNFATSNYQSAYTAEATTEAGKKLVNVSITADGTIEVTPKADATSGTATVEVKNIADSSVKTTFTVKVDEAGAVADYKVSGFEAKLDKFTANTAKTPATTTLSVIPVDANGAQAGEAVVATYIVTDKDNKEVKENNSAIVGTNGVVDASKFEVGKYTLTTKVGTVEVSKQEFEVVNTEAQPTVEFTKTEIKDAESNADLFDNLVDSLKVTPAGQTNLKVTGVKFVSTDSNVVASSPSTFATSIPVVKEGSANLLVSEIQLKDNNGSGKEYTIKLDSNFKVAVTAEYAKVAKGALVWHKDTASLKNVPTTSYATEEGSATLTAKLSNLVADKGGAPATAYWAGVHIDAPTGATKAVYSVTGSNPRTNSEENVIEENQTFVNKGFVYFFAANITDVQNAPGTEVTTNVNNTNNLVITWKDTSDKIVKVEKLTVKFIKEAEAE